MHLKNSQYATFFFKRSIYTKDKVDNIRKKKKIHVNIKYACLIDKIGMP
jgi:general stress protein 26